MERRLPGLRRGNRRKENRVKRRSKVDVMGTSGWEKRQSGRGRAKWTG